MTKLNLKPGDLLYGDTQALAYEEPNTFRVGSILTKEFLGKGNIFLDRLYDHSLTFEEIMDISGINGETLKITLNCLESLNSVYSEGGRYVMTFGGTIALGDYAEECKRQDVSLPEKPWWDLR